MDPHKNCAFGCIMGLLCGDAAGATLEFQHKAITQRDVEVAMKMPGGGVMRVGPGQFTDDSELAISLASALADRRPAAGFPLTKVAEKYHVWYKSHPFDIGTTCSRAFQHNTASKMMEVASLNNSEANGALMRIAPLAVWCSHESEDMIVAYAKKDAKLSHGSQVCQDCNAVFCIAIAYLILHPGDHVGALRRVETFVNAHVFSDVRHWFLFDSLDVIDLDCRKNIGHVRYGFTLAMWCLRNAIPYEDAIKMTLLKGGDTDTNASIVGALMGALHGMDTIPEYMVTPVLEFNPLTNVNGHVRPIVYSSMETLRLIPRLLK